MTTMLYVIRTSARSLSPARPRNGGVRFSPGSSQGSPVTFSEACEMTGTKCCKALFYWRYAESRSVISLHRITRHALGVSDVLAVCCGCAAVSQHIDIICSKMSIVNAKVASYRIRTDACTVRRLSTCFPLPVEDRLGHRSRTCTDGTPAALPLS